MDLNNQKIINNPPFLFPIAWSEVLLINPFLWGVKPFQKPPYCPAMEKKLSSL